MTRPGGCAVIFSDDSDELYTPEARARVDGEDATEPCAILAVTWGAASKRSSILSVPSKLTGCDTLLVLLKCL